MDNKNPLNLSDFLKEIVPEETNYGVFMSGPTSGRIHDVVQSELITIPTTATLFWDAFSETEFFAYYISQIPGLKIHNIEEMMIVSHGQEQFSLLVFAKEIPESEHFIIRANECPDQDIITGYERWSARNEDELNNLEYYIADNFSYDNERVTNFRNLSMILRSASSPEFMFDILKKATMNIVVNRAPEKVMTNSNWAAQPFHSVTPRPGDQPNSTAGIYSTNRDGIFGVTVCRHALGNAQVNQLVEINGMPGTVISDDPISDSCFVSLPGQKPLNLSPFNGPLQVVPKLNETAVFEGFKSGNQQAIITSWDKDILLPIPQIQRKIFTNAVTNQGDSGAALINSDGKAVGFSFYRTGIGAQPEYSAWIWAESVFQVHNLQF